MESNLFMSKHILFNLASRSRPYRFLKVCQYIVDHATGPYTILVKVDIDDPKLQEYLQVPSKTGKQEVYQYRVARSKSKIHAINRDIDVPFDILVNVSDDTMFTEPSFCDYIRQCGPDDFMLFPEPYADSQAGKKKRDR